MINGLTLILIIAIASLVMAKNALRSRSDFWKVQAFELSKKINDNLINEQTNKQNSR